MKVYITFYASDWNDWNDLCDSYNEQNTDSAYLHRMIDDGDYIFIFKNECLEKSNNMIVGELFNNIKDVDSLDCYLFISLDHTYRKYGKYINKIFNLQIDSEKIRSIVSGDLKRIRHQSKSSPWREIISFYIDNEAAQHVQLNKADLNENI